MTRLLLFPVAVLVVLAAPGVQAQQLVYRPLNPAFGGSPANYSWLFSSAQAQNEYTETRDPDDQLADFQENLQRRLLNELARQIVGDRFDGVDLGQEGSFDFGDFLIDVIPGADGVTIRVFNTLTGDESTITVPLLP